MQIIEKEIGRAVSPYFGELVCMADTEDNPCFWAIKKKMDFFAQRSFAKNLAYIVKVIVVANLNNKKRCSLN